MITPAGRYLGRKRDRPDPRDHRFAQHHFAAMSAPLPRQVDLRPHLPPAFDQGQLGSCGPNAGDGLMCFLFPERAAGGFARLQIYYDVRAIEGDVGDDSGVETRDVLATLQKTGAAPETDWPYDVSRFKQKPVADVYARAAQFKLESYSRLVAEAEFLACLASGFPFLLGFECFTSIDSDRLAASGVMPYPNPSEANVGGHDVLVVGYDLDFKRSADLKRSGLDPSTVGDEALLIRNSWGSGWGLGGHFWMPMSYAVNPSTGGDAWTGRRLNPLPQSSGVKTMPVQGQSVDPGEIAAVKASLQQYADQNLSFLKRAAVTDAVLAAVAERAIAAIDSYRSGQQV